VQRAIELTREALATDPLRAAWYNQLARYSTALNRLDEAERALHQAMELQPTVTSHYELLTVIEIQRGDAQVGLAAAQRVAPGARQDVALDHGSVPAARLPARGARARFSRSSFSIHRVVGCDLRIVNQTLGLSGRL
jgi:cytochrome c-type biogenesis protein CcmH/NrfG